MTDAAWLRSLPTLTGHAPEFHLANVPNDPIALFRNWLAVAAGRGIAEPHVMTLATVDSDGMPDARTLILSDVDEGGWVFTDRRGSATGVQLADRPIAALAFWWQPLIRGVRVRGRVLEASREEFAGDSAPDSPDDWALWRVVPERVEFWQGSPHRGPVRLVYRALEDGWTHSVLGGEIS